MTVKLVREGEEFGIELPEELLAHLRVVEGDEVVLARTENGVRLTRHDSEPSGDGPERPA